MLAEWQAYHIRYLSTTFIHFDNIDHENFWIWIIGRNKVVECDTVVVDITT